MERSEPSRIIDQLVRAHAGDPWHGSPVMTVLNGVTAKQAAQRPPHGAHSIWELVLHMTGWRNEVAARITGKAAGDPDGGDYPAIGKRTSERWTAALGALDAAHRRLVDVTSGLTDEQLVRPTKDPRNDPPAPGATAYELLHGIVQHDAYHAGQIAILKKILGFSG
jgi:uncharacterized damage-inducible protein DinB